MTDQTPSRIHGSASLEASLGRKRAQFLRLCVRAVLALAFAIGLTAGEIPGPTEYQLKAAFLFNFLKFTDWPTAAFTTATDPVVIGVLGMDPFGSALDEVVKDESIHGRRIALRRLESKEDSTACHVVFVSRSEKGHMPGLLTSLKKRPVLTLSDLDRFCEQGGMINLTLSSGGTVKPEINPDAARAAGVQISSKLLHLPSVRLVKGEN